MPVNLVVLGAAGRMGRTLLGTALADPELRVVGGVDRPDASELGADLGVMCGRSATGIKLSASLEDLLAAADVTIEFSTPEATLAHLEQTRRAGKAAVIGTTGIDEAGFERLREAARDIPVFQSPNMSLGVNLLFKVLPMIARALGEGYDIEVVETHHNQKKDAPSGTALKLAEVVAEALGKNLKDDAVYGRQGIQPRRPGEIGIHAIRAGSVVGDHSVFFVNDGEQIEIAHRAFSRQTFAFGALRAARWLASKQPGLYNMQDLLAEI